MNQVANTPKVSVCVITYNQGTYIRQCLQSIVDQQTSFDFEIIVGDDCSTDDTQEIIREFADRYPGLIIPILNTRKIGGTQNYLATHLRARGEYVAHLDGDDIAFAGKLQRLSDHLDRHQDLAVVWHAVVLFDDTGRTTGLLHRHIDDVLDTNNITRSDFLRFGSLGAASSVMYRRGRASFLSSVHGAALDYYFSTRLLERGNGARIPDVLGGYRYNPTAATLSKVGLNYFRRSPMRDLYAAHLKEAYSRDKRVRRDIFLNALFNFCVEFRFLRPSIWPFLSIAISTFSPAGAMEVPAYFAKALRLRIR